MTRISIRLTVVLLIALLPLFQPAPAKGAFPATGMEQSGYTRLTTSAEVSAYLTKLDGRSSLARKEVLGQSAGGRPIEALFLCEQACFQIGGVPDDRLTVLLVGSQHGTEPSGGEALLILARELLEGPSRPMLKDTNFILIPNSNPDGRDHHKRVNHNGVNLSTDFSLLSQPESRVLNEALLRFQPEVLLDIHESAVLKKKTLGSQGYLTDFEAQFEIANNPNVDPKIQNLSLQRLLPEILARVQKAGLPARRYIGEITSIHQPITHGGLSLRNLRNKAGMSGAFSFLVENRLDSAEVQFPTFRNIRERVRKQLLSIKVFLEVIREHKVEIMRLTQETRAAPARRPILLHAGYTLDKAHPHVSLQLRKRASGEPSEISFTDHRAVENRYPLPMPAGYLVTDHEVVIRELLDRHRIAYQTIREPSTKTITVQRFAPGPSSSTLPGKGEEPAAPKREFHMLDERRVKLTAQPGDLWIDLDQSSGRLIPLLLDPRSTSSIFLSPGYDHLIHGEKDFFIYRVDNLKTQPGTSHEK